jgi:hypothetical protein
MSRPAAASDFPVDVPNVGAFFFAKRMLRDEMRIAAEYSRLTEGVETPSTWLAIVAGWISALKVLTVSAPQGWDIDAMDPLDPATYDKLRDVHSALREKEDSFRAGAGKAGQASGPRAGEVEGVLVPAQVQSGAD